MTAPVAIPPAESPAPPEAPSFPGTIPAPQEQRVLILAPSGNDAQLTALFLRQSGIDTYICTDMPHLVRCIGEACGALLIAEESLDAEPRGLLSSTLAAQPSWSDIPVGIVTSRGEPDGVRQQRLEAFGRGNNITLIERPFRPTTLLRTVHVALRTRQRQYEVRDLWTVLQSNEARIRRLLEQTAVGLAELDLDGRFTMVNDQFCATVHRSRDELLSLRIRDITYPDDLEQATARRAALISGSASSSVIEKRYLRPDGSPIWVQDHFSTIRDLTGKLCGIALASADITERKRAQEEADRARDAAVAASRAKDDFLAALSHELRTPLNPVLLLASEGEQRLDYPPSARADFATISRNVSLEARLFDDLLDLTRITRGKLSLERQPHDLHASLRDAMTTVAHEIQQKQIKLVCELTTQPAVVMGDSVRLQQVFWNVLKNAVKFTPQGGTVTVTTSATGGETGVITISDTGIGMTPTELERIFDTFGQGDHAVAQGAHRFGGLGLGLAISKTLIELHGGTITATSAGRDLGAVFRIELPLTRIASNSPLPGAAAGTESQPAFEAGPRARVLVVEDHEPTRVALARLLTRRKFQVYTAGSVTEALTIASRGTIELILSDIGLPDGTGYDLMRELRAVHGLRGIALTGYGQEQDIALSRAAGFTTHLTKPVDVRSLDKALVELHAVPAP